MAQLSLEELNAADEPKFIAALTDVFEHAPWVAQLVAGQLPFPTVAAPYDAMSAAVSDLPPEKKFDLILAHPDLAGKAARAGAMTDHSKAEQSSAGLDSLSDRQFEAFEHLNHAYRGKFGFPFIVCVRRHTKRSILHQFERRLENERSKEADTAVGEICRIAALRLDERVAAPDRLNVHGHLSTHVLDTHAGHPAAAVAISLVELSDEGEERLIARGVTNRDGRTDRALIAERPIPIGGYELRFDIGDYFAKSGAPLADPPFLGVVRIRFGVAEPEAAIMFRCW
jgi:2-oxo-4-hydroxy-4-carboxy-5-ureidoimidazoline decarboxylase